MFVAATLLSGCDKEAAPAAADPAKSEGTKSEGTKSEAAKPELSAKEGEGTPKAPKDSPKLAAGTGPVLDHAVKTLSGEDTRLSDYRGKALLVVNTASQCGYTPQYEGLQELYGTYKDKGFEVLAFPSNDFGAQEPGTADEIETFVTDKYSVGFPMFAKVPVVGEAKAPLYKTLTEDTPEGIKGEVKWNFTKFLVDPAGHVVARFEPNVDPMDSDLTAKLESVLPKGG